MSRDCSTVALESTVPVPRDFLLEVAARFILLKFSALDYSSTACFFPSLVVVAKLVGTADGSMVWKRF